MKYEEIIKLLDAGYSREEILEMQNPEDPEETPVDPQPEPESADVNEMISSVMSEMKDAFEGFKKEIQAMNIMNSQIDPPEVLTGEDLIGKIINPFPTNSDK